MGLYCSHDAFSGAYSAFGRLRQEVARAIGASYPPHNVYQIGMLGFSSDQWYWGEGYSQATHPGLYEFFSHSDCDGEISPEMCIHVADELEQILPRMPESGDGHILARGGYRAVLKQFIEGCRAAAAANEPLRFM